MSEVPWFQKVLRSNGRPNCDAINATKHAAFVAEKLRPAFEEGPVTLRQYFDYYQWVHGGMPMLEKDVPFWTKQRMKVIRGLVLAGFTLKPKEANSEGAVGGEVGR